MALILPKKASFNLNGAFFRKESSVTLFKFFSEYKPSVISLKLSRIIKEMNLEKKLKEIFGYDHFRSGQKQIIEKVLEGKNTLGILPTGAGKSICYQLPAVLQEGLTLVVSPLISLMKDQVDSLSMIGIAATFINSTLDEQENKQRMQQVRDQKIKLLFIAPERLENEAFKQFLQQLPIGVVAIDEAHCISQWGHDFRSSYLTFITSLNELPSHPVILALTATATPKVIHDIQQLLVISFENTVKTGFLRKNLRFEVFKGIDRRSFLKHYLKKHADESGIIYANTRKEVEELTDFLNRNHFLATRYHAGLSELERQKNQEKFIYDAIPLIVATNAFGMGINKSNVRFVIHYGMPASLEAYYQEAGRAGRDGLLSEAILLFSATDLRLRRYLIEQNDRDEQQKAHDYEKLQQMQAYVYSENCLQRYLLNYFGDEGTDCGQCSNCLDQREQVNVTIEVQKVLSCIYRMGERFGKTMVTQVLFGSKNKNLASRHFEKLSTFGIMHQHSQKEIAEWIDFLCAEGYLTIHFEKFSILTLSVSGVQVIRGQKEVWRRKTMPLESNSLDTQLSDSKLFEHLRALRLTIAQHDKIPPFLIFSDATLKEMCHLQPQNETEFLQVSGVGNVKLKKYGAIFLKAFSDFKNGI